MSRRRGMGPRRAALEARRRRGRRRRLAIVTAALAAAGVLGAAVSLGEGNDDLPGRTEGDDTAAGRERDRISTTLVLGTSEDEDSLVWLSLLSTDEARGTGAVVYVPAHTAAEVPGRGLQHLGDAYATGGTALLLVSLESLLEVEFDRIVEISSRDALVWFAELGELSVDVPADLRVAAGRDRARLLLPRGRQLLPPEFLADMLYTVGIDEDDLALGQRHIAFWDALFSAHSEEPAELARATRRAADALTPSEQDGAAYARMLRSLGELGRSDRRIITLPVRQVSVGGDEMYATDQEELVAFLDEVVGRKETAADLVRVEILNGNGVPGIGQVVAEKLVGEGFKVILSGNARRLDYEKTRIIAYDSSPEGLAKAERARDLLTVGRVQVSAQQQGIVDLTIVVGMDFLETG